MIQGIKLKAFTAMAKDLAAYSMSEDIYIYLFIPLQGQTALEVAQRRKRCHYSALLSAHNET